MKKKLGDHTKYTLEEIKGLLKDSNNYSQDIVLLSEEYINSKTPLDFYCKICEEYFKISWNSLQVRNCPCCGKNETKVTKEDIKTLVESRGYSVVEFTGYHKDKGTTFDIRCFRNHVYNTSYREFNRFEINKSGSCKTCIKEGYTHKRKERIKEVNELIKKWGYTAPEGFEHYKNTDKNDFTCVNGHVRYVSFTALHDNPECPKCKGQWNKFTKEELEDILKEYGMQYISGYKTANERFNYICSCGASAYNSLNAIKKGTKCKNCTSSVEHNIEDVVKAFTEVGYTLLEEKYINNKTPMSFICDKGHLRKMSFNSFHKGSRCNDCAYIALRGENSPHWNHNKTEEERRMGRNYPEYYEWRNNVFKRDSHTCQICNISKSGEMVAHHKDSHDWCIVRRLDVSNGVTLCETCHTDFHMQYGYGDNDENQWNEYVLEMKEAFKEAKPITN